MDNKEKSSLRGLFRSLFGEKRKKSKEETYADMMVGLRKRGNLIKSRHPVIRKAYTNRVQTLFDAMYQESPYDFIDRDDFLLSKDDLSMIANATQFSTKKDSGYVDRTGRADIYNALNAPVSKISSLSDQDILKKILQIPQLRQGNR